MFDRETRWFIRCDTCPDDGSVATARGTAWGKDEAARLARRQGWSIRDGLHRCPVCVREGRTAVAS